MLVVVVVVADALISSIVVNDGDAIGVAAVFFCNVVKLISQRMVVVLVINDVLVMNIGNCFLMIVSINLILESILINLLKS